MTIYISENENSHLIKKESHISINTPVSYCLLTRCEITNNGAIIGGSLHRLNIFICCNLSGNKKIISYCDKIVFCVFINNESDKWYMRFGVTVHFPVQALIKKLKWW